MLSPLLRRAAIAFHALLVFLVLLRQGPTIFGAVLAVLLLLPLPGILKGSPYTCGWASMLVTFYAGGYLAAGYATAGARWPLFVVASIAMADFVSLVLFVRFRGRETAARAVREPAARTEA